LSSNWRASGSTHGLSAGLAQPLGVRAVLVERVLAPPHTRRHETAVAVDDVAERPCEDGNLRR
jgi:hypothetical protein